MLIDDVVIKVKAGDGGRGAVAFDKNKMALGPAGGNGGNGGNVFCEGVSDLSALNHFRNKKDINARNGADGRSQFRDGVTSEDMIIQVPVGTVIHNAEAGTDEEIVKIGQRLLVAKGGHGGKGNYLFRGPKSTSPKRFQFGLPGGRADLRLELKLIADVGLIGYPNVGKSSLLNELTRAQSKVANYAFTTLEPNLGTFYELILADLPGLIEGASTGKGLGIRFLRHVERTKILFHLLSAESENIVKNYKAIRKELGAYNKELLNKVEYIFISKSDAVSGKDLKAKIAKLKKLNPKVDSISIYDLDSIERVKKILNKIIKAKKV